MLDSRLGSVKVQTAILDVLVNPLCCFQEGLFHVLTSEEEDGGYRMERLRYRLNKLIYLFIFKGLFRIKSVSTYVLALASRNSKPEQQQEVEIIQ